MSTGASTPQDLRILVGHDGSAPARRAVDGAVASDVRTELPDATVVIVVGSSLLVAHRIVGSVTVSLARHSPVPLVIVP